MLRKINAGGYICNRCNQCKVGHVKERTKQRGGKRTELPNHRPQPLHPLHRLLQPVKPCPLLNVSPFQHRNSLLQSRACLTLLRYHFIRLAEQLCRQILQFRIRLRQLVLCLLAQVLFPTECVLQLQCFFGIGTRMRGDNMGLGLRRR